MPEAAQLRHVRWIGGASGSGKTAVTATLARRFDLRTYSTDVAIRTHGADPGADAPLLARFAALSMDEPLGDRGTDREGFRLLPRLVAPLIDDPRRAVWLVGTPTMRRAVFAERASQQQFWRRTSDPAAGLEHLLERDALFAEAVVQGAELEDTADAIADWFGLREVERGVAGDYGPRR